MILNAPSKPKHSRILILPVTLSALEWCTSYFNTIPWEWCSQIFYIQNYTMAWENKSAPRTNAELPSVIVIFIFIRPWFIENSKTFQFLLISTTANRSFNYSLTVDKMEFSRSLKDVSFRASDFRNHELDFTKPGAEDEKKWNIKIFDEFKSLPALSATGGKLLR